MYSVQVFRFNLTTNDSFPRKGANINPSSFQLDWKGSPIVSIVSLMTPRWMIDNLGRMQETEISAP